MSLCGSVSENGIGVPPLRILCGFGKKRQPGKTNVKDKSSVGYNVEL